MRTFFRLEFQVSILGQFLLYPLVLCAFPVSLTVERAFPPNKVFNFSELRARDMARHRRLLQSSNGVVDFPVFGNADPFKYGLYFTKVKLGSPPKEFNLQIDTGSDITWVSCSGCIGCPNVSGLGIPLGFYDPAGSSSASTISCSDRECTIAIHSFDGSCNNQNSKCNYMVQYADNSASSGYYVSDILHFDMVVGETSAGNSSNIVIFGCSNYLSGNLTKPAAATDGLLGLGQQEGSIIAQLHSQGIVPNVFSHCLRGDGDGGGILVLGEILAPNIVYSPLVPAQYHYTLNLLNIAINGQNLPIDPAVFAASDNRGTIVDSGSTLAGLPEEAYDSFVSYITSAVSQSTNVVSSTEFDHCFQLSNSVDDVFPSVTLNFDGGASMDLRPKNYLMFLSNALQDDMDTWCIAFMKLQGVGTILGDLVLKDKIIVYDLAQQRLGWADYDCTRSVNVSTAGKDVVNTGPLSVSSASHHVLFKLMPIFIAASLLMSILEIPTVLIFSLQLCHISL